MAKPSSNEGLLTRITARDAAALEEFYDRHHRLVYALVLRILNEPTQAEEVVLEIFWQIWQQAGRFSSGRLSANAWLMMISRERALDHLRRFPGRPALPEGGPRFSRNPPQQSEAGAAEARAEARTALDSLTAMQRQALEMAYYRGLNHSEIAAAVREPERLVKSRIRTALDQIRGALRPIASAGGESQ